jgi:asparagine synthase (glutamine-hydrolysing)
MCGLAGYGLSDRAGSVERALLERMTDAIVHRGPDSDGHHVRGPLGIGFRRLSIIDLAGGTQPLFDESGAIAVTCNGEIYNYKELRAGLEARGHRFRTGSDVETIVHLYEEHGARAVEHLVGMFAFALLDSRCDPPKLLLGRDRLGIKPVYYARTERGLAYASEPKAILALDWLPRRLRARALVDYLVQGYSGGEHSAWGGIQRLPPGHVLEWQPGGEPVLTRYWDLPTDAQRGPADSAEIRDWLDRVVREHLIADVPLGAFLSGGIDSSAVVTAMSAALSTPVVACSVGFDEASHDELATARETARILGAHHHTEVLRADPTLALDTLPWFFDEPLADPSTVPTYLVSRMARAHVTVALSGDGGDEVFAGYRRYVHDWAENRLRARIGRTGRALSGVLGRHYPKLDWAPRPLRGSTFLTNLADDPAHAYFRSVTQLELADARALLGPAARDAGAGHDPFAAFAEHYARPRGVDALYRAQYADFHTYLPDQILAKTDRASMAVSLELRPPLLDHRFVERFAPLPAHEKVRGARGKHALREALRGRVRDAVLDGTKRGFDTPLDRWIAGPLAASVEQALRALPADWIDARRAGQLFDEHRAGRRNHARALWSLLVLERWRARHGVEDALA